MVGANCDAEGFGPPCCEDLRVGCVDGESMCFYDLLPLESGNGATAREMRRTLPHQRAVDNHAAIGRRAVSGDELRILADQKQNGRRNVLILRAVARGTAWSAGPSLRMFRPGPNTREAARGRLDDSAYACSPLSSFITSTWPLEPNFCQMLRRLWVMMVEIVAGPGSEWITRRWAYYNGRALRRSPEQP